MGARFSALRGIVLPYISYRQNILLLVAHTDKGKETNTAIDKTNMDSTAGTTRPAHPVVGMEFSRYILKICLPVSSGLVAMISGVR